MQFQVVDILIQVFGSLVDLRVGVPFLETSIGYKGDLSVGSGLVRRQLTFETDELPKFV